MGRRKEEQTEDDEKIGITRKEENKTNRKRQDERK